jgi:hypothetical protein
MPSLGPRHFTASGWDNVKIDLLGVHDHATSQALALGREEFEDQSGRPSFNHFTGLLAPAADAENPGLNLHCEHGDSRQLVGLML